MRWSSGDKTSKRQHDCILSACVTFFLVTASVVSADQSPKQPAALISSPATQATELNNRGVQTAQAGHLEEGAGLLRDALRLNPADSEIRRNLSAMLTDWATQLYQVGDVTRATTIVEEAVQDDQTNGRAFVVLGDLAFLTQDDLSKAIGYWQHAHGKIPADQWGAVSRRLAQAERDRAIERSFQGVETAHFRIRFEGAQHQELATDLEMELEQLYQRLATGFGKGPEKLTVLVYTERNFERVAGGRDWAAGLYDGRIRLRADELRTSFRSSIMAHELAHAFLARAYGPRIPKWIHEGFAQSQEPRPLTDPEQRLMQDAAARQSWIPLKWLDRRFNQPSNLEDLARAYVQSRWVVQQLLQQKGMPTFHELLTRLSGGEPIDRAFDATMNPLRWSRVDVGNFE